MDGLNWWQTGINPLEHGIFRFHPINANILHLKANMLSEARTVSCATSIVTSSGAPERRELSPYNSLHARLALGKCSWIKHAAIDVISHQNHQSSYD